VTADDSRTIGVCKTHQPPYLRGFLMRRLERKVRRREVVRPACCTIAAHVPGPRTRSAGCASGCVARWLRWCVP